MLDSPLSSSLLFISASVPTATIWERCFSNLLILHIAPGALFSVGEEILVMDTTEWEFSSGHLIKQKVAVQIKFQIKTPIIHTSIHVHLCIKK